MFPLRGPLARSVKYRTGDATTDAPDGLEVVPEVPEVLLGGVDGSVAPVVVEVVPPVVVEVVPLVGVEVVPPVVVEVVPPLVVGVLEVLGAATVK